MLQAPVSRTPGKDGDLVMPGSIEDYHWLGDRTGGIKQHGSCNAAYVTHEIPLTDANESLGWLMILDFPSWRYLEQLCSGNINQQVGLLTQYGKANKLQSVPARVDALSCLLPLPYHRGCLSYSVECKDTDLPMAYYHTAISDLQLRDKNALLTNPILLPTTSGGLTAVTLVHTLPEPGMSSRLTSAPVLEKTFRAESHKDRWALSVNYKKDDCYAVSHCIFSQIALYDLTKTLELYEYDWMLFISTQRGWTDYLFIAMLGDQLALATVLHKKRCLDKLNSWLILAVFMEFSTQVSERPFLTATQHDTSTQTSIIDCIQERHMRRRCNCHL